MKEIDHIEQTVDTLREKADEDVSVNLETLADKLEAIATYAKDCRDKRAAAEEQTEEMRDLLDAKYRDGYRKALADVSAHVDGLEESVG